MKSYLKKIILTVALAATTSLNCGDLDTRPPMHRHHDTSIDPSIRMELGSGAKYRRLPRPIVDRSLDSLAKDGLFEGETWLYHNNTLTDVGVYEDTSRILLNEDIIDRALKRARPNDTTIFYHIPPNFDNNKNFNPPSVDEIMTHVQRKPAFMHRPMNTYVKGRMFNGLGMWEYDVDDSVAKRAGVSEKEYYKEADKIYMKMKLQKDFYNHKLPPDFRDTTVMRKAIDEYIKAMRDVGVILKFTPSDKL